MRTWRIMIWWQRVGTPPPPVWPYKGLFTSKLNISFYSKASFVDGRQAKKSEIFVVVVIIVSLKRNKELSSINSEKNKMLLMLMGSKDVACDVCSWCCVHIVWWQAAAPGCVWLEQQSKYACHQSPLLCLSMWLEHWGGCWTTGLLFPVLAHSC